MTLYLQTLCHYVYNLNKNLMFQVSMVNIFGTIIKNKVSRYILFKYLILSELENSYNM